MDIGTFTGIILLGIVLLVVSSPKAFGLVLAILGGLAVAFHPLGVVGVIAGIYIFSIFSE